MERLNHPSRGVVVGERHRSVVELGGRIQVGPIALGHGDGAEMIVGRPVLVHVALRDERILRIDAEQAVVRVHALRKTVRGCRSCRVALVRRRRTQRSVGEYARDDLGHAGVDRLRRMHDHRSRSRAAKVHRRGQPQVADTHRILQRRRRHRIVEPGDPGIDEQAVEVGALKAGVFEGEIDGLGSEADRTGMIEVFAHPGLSEPGNSAFTF